MVRVWCITRIKTFTVSSRLFFLFTFGGAYLFYSFRNSKEIKFFDTFLFSTISEELSQQPIEDLGYTINTEGCRIPRLKAFDESINKFIFYPRNDVTCPRFNISLLASNNTYIWVNRTNFQFYHIHDQDDFLCCYKPFFRPNSIDDITSNLVDDRVKYLDCVNFTNYIQVNDEFVRVTCNHTGTQVYEQYFLFAIKKPFQPHDDLPMMRKDKNAYNVLVLGIDAVSRLNFHRTMPKTLNFLKKMGAIELFGYNKVGDNTFPNLVPMLLGISEQDLKFTCLPHSKTSFDNCPFIWEWFKQAGFFTAFAEDSASLGTFNYLKLGFINAPTDYYSHPFLYEAERNIGTNRNFNSYICMNDKYFFQVLLNYIESLTDVLKGAKLFGFFWECTMSHDYLNFPMLMDASYEKFLQNLNDSNYLKNSIIFFVSDHGIRWGGIRSTMQGRLEERLPFVYMLLPDSFRKKYTTAYNNLIINSRRLTTPFDLHATLSDLTDLHKIDNEILIKKAQSQYSSRRDISLFLPIPRNRTCRMAAIDEHWCTCQHGKSIKVDGGDAQSAGKILVEMLNGLVAKYPQCDRLQLDKILSVTELTSPKAVANDKESWHELSVIVVTKPGGGMFEATLRRSPHGLYELSGSVSRLNLYGNQSHCVQNFHLKLYCYCL